LRTGKSGIKQRTCMLLVDKRMPASCDGQKKGRRGRTKLQFLKLVADFG